MLRSWIQAGRGIEITEGRDNILSETKKLPEDISAAFWFIVLPPIIVPVAELELSAHILA